MARTKRPVFLDLRHIQMPVGALASIGHRISDVGLAIGVPVVVYLLALSLKDEKSFADVASHLRLVPVKAALVGLVWAISHHVLAGVRHLLSDRRGFRAASPFLVRRRRALKSPGRCRSCRMTAMRTFAERLMLAANVNSSPSPTAAVGRPGRHVESQLPGTLANSRYRLGTGIDERQLPGIPTTSQADHTQTGVRRRSVPRRSRTASNFSSERRWRRVHSGFEDLSS